jgi:hypothetical protein
MLCVTLNGEKGDVGAEFHGEVVTSWRVASWNSEKAVGK